MSAQIERITLTRRIRAAPERVYGFFTDPDLWARWQGTSATVDARPGGVLQVVMGLSGSGVAEGRFVELDPFERIVFTWGWASSPLSTLPPGSTLVTVHLRPDGDGTLLTLTHDLLPPSERDIHEAGWSLYMDRLVAVAEGGDPGPDPSLMEPDPTLRPSSFPPGEPARHQEQVGRRYSARTFALTGLVLLALGVVLVVWVANGAR